ncbi:MAG: Flp pilus assembly complex ATPase component TadA [Candidatus Latescibacteria bacterium]|nr:Flp pilus assembly complex ATPase component TadA [Candidatus Latescibacterota bacterium]
MAGRKRIGEMLIEAGVLDEASLERALVIQKETARKLGDILMQEGLIEENVLLNFLRNQLHVDVISSDDLKIADEIWKKVPEELVKKYNVLPLKIENRELTVAMSDPLNLVAIDDLRFATSCYRVKVFLAAESTIKNILHDRFDSQGLIYDIIDHGKLFQKALDTIDKNEIPDIPVVKVEEETISSHVIELESHTPPIISLVNYIFVEALRREASDIHIEPYQTYFRIRLRIDGMLHTILTPPHRLHVYIVSRIKIMSEMDISKRYIPQDGHMALKINHEDIHYRVSTLPTVYGEKCVLRVIKKHKYLEDVNTLGFAPQVLEQYKKVIRYPYGMILFTGPTGSGKTTTLYASLNYVNNNDINIITLEDPVESTLYGINHVQIRQAHGLTFADGLRSILRQDPDIVFVGEIRDAEVASIAMRASMTGHLVFSTLHTNSTADSFERLVDMGVEPYLVSSTVLAVVAQRLVRRICSKCRRPYEPTPEEIEEFGLDDSFLSDAVLNKGEGCSHCMGTGYSGRVAVFEVLFVGPRIREIAKDHGRSDAIGQAAAEEGMRTILDDGLDKVRQGITTFDEVRRVLIAGVED